MSIGMYLILVGGIVCLWVLAGKGEWKIPQSAIQRIENIRAKMTNQEILDVMTLTIEAREFAHDDIEKEIYIVRKSRNLSSQQLLINVDIQTNQSQIGPIEKEKTKQRLEKRFPGITVNFSEERQEENVILRTDQ